MPLTQISNLFIHPRASAMLKVSLSKPVANAYLTNQQRESSEKGEMSSMAHIFHQIAYDFMLLASFDIGNFKFDSTDKFEAFLQKQARERHRILIDGFSVGYKVKDEKSKAKKRKTMKKKKSCWRSKTQRT